ncbi:MAG: hypothetical protein JW818_08175 [Pirellulales bacterium]|nr:hypothetical protein [Pirellulales bacterium]
MQKGFEHVFRAVRLLVGRNAKIHQRLYEATRELALALKESEQWPPDLFARAAQIHGQLTARGRADTTINDMDTAAAEQLANAILDVALAVDGLKRHRLEMSSHPAVPRPLHRRSKHVPN